MNRWKGPNSHVARTNARDRRTILLLLGYCALGLAVLITLVCLAPLVPTLVWRAR